MAQPIKLVHAEEVRGLLTHLGFLDSVEAGEVTCCSCGSVVTVENFRAVERRDGMLRFYCTAPQCTVDPVSETTLGVAE